MNLRCTSRLTLALLVPLALAACGGRATPAQLSTPRPAATEAARVTPAATALAATSVPAPTPGPSRHPLTGQRLADPAVARHRPILVRYGHDRMARPPSGLGSAALVYEEMVEGNFVTRLTAAFLGTLPEVAGPVRSARPVVIDLMQQLDAALVISGASVGVSQLLGRQPYPQYNHVGHGRDLFFRTTDRPAPHNLYINLVAVRARLAAEGADKAPDLRGLAFSPTPPQGSQVALIQVPYPGQAFVEYRYDEASGTYLRFVEGTPHIDALSGKQLAPANVIVFYAEHKNSDIVEDTLGNVALLINQMGQGRVQVFRDGVMVEGTWQRAAPRQLARYLDPSGQDIPLKPGQSWIQIVPVGLSITIE